MFISAFVNSSILTPLTSFFDGKVCTRCLDDSSERLIFLSLDAGRYPVSINFFFFLVLLCLKTSPVMPYLNAADAPGYAKRKFWSMKNGGTTRPLIPPHVMENLKTTPIACVEYSKLSPDLEREIFQVCRLFWQCYFLT